MAARKQHAVSKVWVPVLLLAMAQQVAASGLSFESLRSTPYPEALTAAREAPRVAWVADEKGRRNVWVAEAPAFQPRRVTAYLDDDGQELTSLSLSGDGSQIVYVRGGEHGANWSRSAPVNASSHPAGGQVAVWSIPFAGGEPSLMGEGDYPAISPDGRHVAFIKNDQAWIARADGSLPAEQLFVDRGRVSNLRWSPDGTRLAFVSQREVHSFIGIYQDERTPIRWLAPSVTRDESPRWSADGTRIAFVRTPGDGGVPPLVTTYPIRPWEIWSADVESGEAKRWWRSGENLRDSWPAGFFDWWADNEVVFLSYQDGWPHLYSVSARSSRARLLTPGEYMVEHVALSPDRRSIVFSANTGDSPDDTDRRHLYALAPDSVRPQALTRGDELEFSPAVLSDGSVAFIGSGARRALQPALLAPGSGAHRWLGGDVLPAQYPLNEMVVPRRVQFRADDGVLVTGQLFEPRHRRDKGPAVVYVHGGPKRQMLLGWHPVQYYGNGYALNQYLASRGFMVLSVNYRLGVGYGHALEYPPEAGEEGAAELRDVVAAGRYLQSLPSVDERRVGVYGGSYGGYLTALALARHSDLFAVGVDIHGIHDWVMQYGLKDLFVRTRYEIPANAQAALDTAWRASPVFDLSSWRSPILLIHADDDRNVRFSQSVDLVRRLEKTDVHHEVIVFPDETHNFKRFDTQRRIAVETADFLERFIGERP